ncbi:MAG TPA: serine--tRNA ligase [Clostridia bacterium]|nr:serine--tRNA ligase [Clostridia bacterium]
MLDIKRIRENPEFIKAALENRREKGAQVQALLELDIKRRELIAEAEILKNRRNEVSAQIPALKRSGSDTTQLMDEMKETAQSIKALDAELLELEAGLSSLLYTLPNIAHESVPVGKSEAENKEQRVYGELPKFGFEPKPHWELGESLGILDFATAAKVTGSRFTFYKGLGARLERAIINFFLDTHTCESGYTEIFPPFIVNRASMVGTGQLPKFEDDAFKLTNSDYFLIPTAEVPVTNMFRDEILSPFELPQKFCAYSACFRAEAGSAGRDTRGLIRQHQFNKVELVKFTSPETSYAELEALTKDAELVLKKLGLAYRVVSLCTGDLGFASAKTYDIEVYMPSYGRYVEISSCSNCEDFQARRANIRFRREEKAKPEFVHTLNGSGVAVGRTVAAIIENFQQQDGSVKLPKALVPYMGANLIEPKR